MNIKLYGTKPNWMLILDMYVLSYTNLRNNFKTLFIAIEHATNNTQLIKHNNKRNQTTNNKKQTTSNKQQTKNN